MLIPAVSVLLQQEVSKLEKEVDVILALQEETRSCSLGGMWDAASPMADTDPLLLHQEQKKCM